VTPEGEDPRTSAVALGDVASVQITSGPPMVRDDSGLLVGYVYVDIDATRDLGSWVEDAQQLVQRAIARGDVVLPVGGHLRWTGQYEQMQEMEERLRLLVPLALLSVVLLLYLQFRDFTEVLIVLLSVPFALVGSVWAIYLLGHHLSAAVWVGIIALIGLATQTGVVMIVYIDQAYRRRLAEGRIRSRADIIEAHAEGTILRVRPKLMTVGTMLVGLAPLLWAEGSGADVMRRIAAPMVGGLVTSAFLTLELIPVIYTYWRDEQRIRGLLAAHVPAVHRELGRWITALRAGLAGVVAALAARLLIRAEGADALIGAAGVAGTATLVLSSMAYVGVRRLGLRHLPGATAPETTGDGHA
jgi:Cu(I)/Ag(I) efflux system membrane protein CusA/SilA